MNQPKFLFGDIVVIDTDHIGVIVKSWESMLHNCFYYEVYDRMTNQIVELDEVMIDRYRVRHKYLNEEEMGYQFG